jgi:hypothetical protein
MTTKLISLIVAWLTSIAAVGQIVNPITNGVLNTDLNAAGFQVDNIGRLGFGTATPASRITILPAGNPTTSVDGLQLGPDVFIYRSSAGNLSITGNLAVSGTLSSTSGIVNLGGINAWTGINSWAGPSTFNGPTTIGNTGLSFSGSGASTTRAALSLTVGTNVQAYSPRLAEISALGVSPAGFMYANGTNWVLTPLASVRAAVGLGSSDSPTFAGLTLSSPLSFPNGGTGIGAIAVNKILYSAGVNTLTSTDLSPYVRTSILPADDASAAITALTLNTLTGALSGSILSPTLAANAVTTVSINTNAVTTPKVADGAITTLKLAATGVAAGTYGSAVNIPQLIVNAQGQVVSIGNVPSTGLTSTTPVPLDSTFFTGNYGDPLIRNNSITDVQLYANGVIAGTYGASDSIPQITITPTGRISVATGVPFTGLTTSSVTTGDLVGGTYANTVIAANAITTPKLADNSVSASKLQDSAVSAAKIATGAVTTAKLADANVTNVKLGADAVTSDKITAGAVTTSDIGDTQVTSVKIAPDAVALGTQTTGDYVRTITSSNMTVTGSGAENADLVLSLPQNLDVAASPTFVGIRVNGGVTGVIHPGRVITVAGGHPDATNTRTGLSAYDAFRPFSTITAAITAAVNGDAIHILRNAAGDGVYSEAALWNKDLDVVLDNGTSVNGIQEISGSCNFTGGRFFSDSGGSDPTMRFLRGTSKLDTVIERYSATASAVDLDPSGGESLTVEVNGGRISAIGTRDIASTIIDTNVQGSGESINLVFNGGMIGYNWASTVVAFGPPPIALDVKAYNTVKISANTRIDGRLVIDSNAIIITAPNVFAQQFAKYLLPGTAGILDNATASVLAYGSVDSGVDPMYSKYVLYSSGTGVLRPLHRALITFEGSVGLTPTGLTDVVAGDKVELLLQFSGEGTSWATVAVLDTYNISVAGGGSTFKLGGVTTQFASIPPTSSGGYRLVVKCTTAAGTGSVGSYVKSNDTTYSHFSILVQLR